MGSAVSSGIDNNDLVDNLVRANYIRTLSVERSFRAVDRGSYLLTQNSSIAYRDTAWKSGHLHISAPCIYSEVLENLQLGSGMSFLNIGSGTGYLSTMAGLLLGGQGINHGIEFYGDVVDYAKKKLEEFKKTSPAIDTEDFCEPVFVNGNALNIQNPQLYDRIYCGAACPATEINFIHKLLKVGGILVVPCQDDLLKIVRKTDTLWEGQSILPVSFATLRIPTGRDKLKKAFLPKFKTMSLQDMCRFTIRKSIREQKIREMPEMLECMKRVEKLYKPSTEEAVENNNRNGSVFVMHGLEEVIRNRSPRTGSNIVFMHRVLDNFVSRRTHMRNHIEHEERADGNTSDNSTNSSNIEREATRQDGRIDQEENSDRMEVGKAGETAATEDVPIAETNRRAENEERRAANGSSDSVRGARRQLRRIHGRIYTPHNYTHTGLGEPVGVVRSAVVPARPRHAPTHTGLGEPVGLARSAVASARPRRAPTHTGLGESVGLVRSAVDSAIPRHATTHTGSGEPVGLVRSAVAPARPRRAQTLNDSGEPVGLVRSAVAPARPRRAPTLTRLGEPVGLVRSAAAPARPRRVPSHTGLGEPVGAERSAVAPARLRRAPTHAGLREPVGLVRSVVTPARLRRAPTHAGLREPAGAERSAVAPARPRRPPTVITYTVAGYGLTTPLDYSMAELRSYGLGNLTSRNAAPTTEVNRANPIPASSSNVRKKCDSEVDSQEDQESVKRMKIDTGEERLVGDAPVEKVEADSVMESNEDTEVNSRDTGTSDLCQERLPHETSRSVVSMPDSNTENNSTESMPPNDAIMDQSNNIEEASSTCQECGADTSVGRSNMEEGDGSTQSSIGASASGINARASGAGRRTVFSNRGIAILTISSSDSSDGESSSSGDDGVSQDVSSVLRSIRMRMMDEISLSRRLARLNNYRGSGDRDVIIERRSVPLREGMRDNAAQTENNSSETSTSTESNRMNVENGYGLGDNTNWRRRYLMPSVFDIEPIGRTRNPESPGSQRSADDPVELYKRQIWALKAAIREGIQELPLPPVMKSYLDFFRDL